jgi:Tol biopolymer transport system component
MKSLARLLMAYLILIAAAIGPQSAHGASLARLYLPLVATEPGTLAFTATTRFVGMGPTGIAAMPIGGTALTWLRQDSASEYSSHPAYSPDGTHVAFFLGRPGSADLCVMHADGSGLVRLTTIITGSADVAGLTWSPDGSQIAFAAGGQIQIINTDGTHQHVLVAGAVFPAWSPDGTRIAFAGNGISTIAPDGSALKQISPLAAHAAISWSPDSQQLAFANQSSDITIMTADGVVLREISHLGLADSIDDVAWSPDGAWLAYESYTPLYTFRVGVIRIDGTEPHWLQYSGWAFDPAWRR